MKRAEMMNMVAIMCAGVFANSMAHEIINNQYNRQNLIQQMIWDVQTACIGVGITITDESEAMETKE